MKEFKEAHGGSPRTLAQEDALLKDKARANAKSLAFANLPALEDKADGYLKSMRAGYEGILSREMKKLPANADLVADLELKASEQKGAIYSEKLNQAKKQLHNATLEMGEMEEGDDGRHINVIPIWMAIFIIAAGEAFLTYKSVGTLLDAGNNLVLGLILISFTALYTIIPKALRWYYSDFCAGKKYKAILYMIPIIVLASGYFTLGFLRSHFIQMQASMDVNADSSAAPSFIASPYVFVALNCLFLLASYYLASMLPTREQDKYRRDVEKREANIAKLEAEVEKYEGLLGQMPDHGKNNLIRASSSNTSRKDLYQQVNSMFLQTCGVFFDTNLQYRTDGVRPKCFDEPIEPLQDIYTNQ